MKLKTRLAISVAALGFTIGIASAQAADKPVNPSDGRTAGAGPLGDKYMNQNINSPNQVVFAQWRKGELLNVWPKANAETAFVFPEPVVK